MDTLINILNGNSCKTAIKEYIQTTLKLSWHHTEDLKTLQLIPKFIHSKTGHSGGATIQKEIDAASGLSKINMTTAYHAWRNSP